MRVRAYWKTKKRFPNDDSWGIGIFYYGPLFADPANLDIWLGRFTVNARWGRPLVVAPDLTSRLRALFTWQTLGFGVVHESKRWSFSFGPWEWPQP